MFVSGDYFHDGLIFEDWGTVWTSTKVGCDLDGKYLSSQKKKNVSSTNTLAYFGHQSAKKSPPTLTGDLPINQDIWKKSLKL